jgi:Regulator of Chromosome Condensation (RCC1) repeat protein/regulator of chromosome condensation (RCC1) repeat-containing protein
MRARVAIGFLVVLPAAALAQDSLKFTLVTAGGWHTCAITTAGAAYCWGYGRFGQLGNGDTGVQTVPAPVEGGLRFTTVGAGRFHTCGLTTDSIAYCWGSNSWGQLGSESAANGCTNRKGNDTVTIVCSLRPRAVAGGRHFATLSVNGLHACAITGDHEAYCWGSNGTGQLGIGPGPISVPAPTAVAGGLKFVSVAAGLNHSCGVTVAGQLYCWGFNKDNQLATDTVKGSLAPLAIPSDVKFVFVTAGGSHSCAIAADTTAYCWGEFEHGRLGIGESFTEVMTGKQHQMTPAAVDLAIKYRSLSAGGVHTCGVALSGEAYCWGDNLGGRLGKGGSFLTRHHASTKPSPPKGNLRLTMISAGDYHTCGVTSDGALYCWGGNEEGQLGNGTTKGKGEPVRVSALKD